MRIALDASYSVDPHPSGVAIYSREILRGVAAFHADDEFLHCYRWKQWRRRPPSSLPNACSRILQRPLRLGRPDVFHALNQRVDWRAAPRVVVTFHDLFVMTGDYSTADFRRRFTQQAKQAVELADVIIAVSEFTAGQVRDLLGVPPGRIRTIPHGVHHLTVQSDLPREKIILFVGALQRRKNVLRLVQAFEQLPGEWHLVLAGAKGGYEADKILEYIERSSCRRRIRLAGYLDNAALENLYARASIFAFPSLDEGFGMPVLEAMAHGVPVLTSRRSALIEVAGSAALLVDPDDVDAISAGLLSLIHDDDLRMRLTGLGKQRAQEFSWSNAVASTYRLYRELCSQTAFK